MQNKHLLIYPLAFLAILAPVLVVALITYRPDDNGDCAALPAVVSHSHGTGLAVAIKDDMQLIFNVSAAAALYEVVDGKLALCGDTSDTALKHVTVDVNDARLALGERLPVRVDLTIRRADTGGLVVEAAAPAMYAPGHGYHYGDNFLLPPGAAYEWTVVISPVDALRQDGAQDLWLEPVTWGGSFELGADGSITGKASGVQPVGDMTDQGLHIMVGTQDAAPLYEVTAEGGTVPQPVEEGSRYFVVDVTDHAVNYEEKLPGATVTLTFRQGQTVKEVTAQPVISPVYGFHYGANVALGPGDWQITVTVSGLDFLRHAGAAVGLARSAVTGTFEYTVG